MSELEQLYELACQTPSDINEHLPVLRQYAAQCKHVTEFGMRSAVSTTALLAAQPDTLISWDINPWAIVSDTCAALVAHAGRTRFQPRVGDTLSILIEPTDMLFIDSLHTSRQLLAELARHARTKPEDPAHCRVRKYLAFHDTVTFGSRGEDGSEPGLRAAIEAFQQENYPLWRVVEDRENNNGLVVLERA